MDREHRQWIALEYLDKQYEQWGPDAAAFRIQEAVAETGLPLEQLQRALRQIVDSGMATEHRGGGLGAENGYVWINQLGLGAMDQRRKPAPPPATVQVLLAGFTPEGRQEFYQLFSQVRADEQAKFKQLVEELNDTSRSDEDRLEKAEKLASLLQNSSALVASVLGPHAPQAISVLQQFINR